VLAALGSDRAEPLQQSISGLRAEVANPGFVGRTNVVAHVLECEEIKIRLGGS
jgi:hypothetical protein